MSRSSARAWRSNFIARQLHGSGTVTDGAFWQQMTEAALRCYLHAAALDHRTMRDVLGWGPLPSGNVVAMSAAEHMSLADVKNRLSEVVERLEREHGRVVITKHGRPAAVVLSVQDLEGRQETLEILSDPRLMQRVRKANKEIAADQAEELTKEQALALARRK